MNINVKVKIRENWQKNEGGIPTKCLICLLCIRLDYKIWYQIKFETLPFNQNY